MRFSEWKGEIIVKCGTKRSFFMHEKASLVLIGCALESAQKGHEINQERIEFLRCISWSGANCKHRKDFFLNFTQQSILIPHFRASNNSDPDERLMGAHKFHWKLCFLSLIVPPKSATEEDGWFHYDALFHSAQRCALERRVLRKGK